MGNENLLEYSAIGGGVKVDRQAGIIRGCRIIGHESKNGRSYPDGTLRGAIPLYENASVNVNHPKGSATGPRDYQDRIGRIRGVVADAGGLRGDFHFNPKHALAEQLMWDAEHAPENVGFSHNVEANVSRRTGKVVVEEIVKVQSVDLVADPATTCGLFEVVPTRRPKRSGSSRPSPRKSIFPFGHFRRWIRDFPTATRRRRFALISWNCEVYVRRGIIEALDLPDPEGAKQFAAAITTDGSYDPNMRKQFNDATDLADADEVKEFVRKITD